MANPILMWFEFLLVIYVVALWVAYLNREGCFPSGVSNWLKTLAGVCAFGHIIYQLYIMFFS